MAEIVRSERQSHNHKWDRIKAKEGEDFTVTLDPKQRALVFAMLSFASYSIRKFGNADANDNIAKLPD